MAGQGLKVWEEGAEGWEAARGQSVRRPVGVEGRKEKAMGPVERGAGAAAEKKETGVSGGV